MPKIVKKETVTRPASGGKKAVKVAKKIATPKSARAGGLSVPLYSLAGKTSGTLTLPKEIFGQKVSKKLIAQAIRVYSTNQKSLPGSTKTRGEVEGSTVKIFRQKGTGRARHGSVRAPIFVGGGIVFGPTPRKVRLNLPSKMKKAALISALSSKASEKEVFGVAGLEKATGKTKEIVSLLKKMEVKNALIVVGEKQDNVIRAVKNITDVHVLSVNLINAYEILKHRILIVTKEAIEGLTK